MKNSGRSFRVSSPSTRRKLFFERSLLFCSGWKIRKSWRGGSRMFAKQTCLRIPKVCSISTKTTRSLQTAWSWCCFGASKMKRDSSKNCCCSQNGSFDSAVAVNTHWNSFVVYVSVEQRWFWVALFPSTTCSQVRSVRRHYIFHEQK